MNPAPRWPWYLAAGTILWLALILVWAARPLHETLNVGLDELGRTALVTVECENVYNPSAGGEQPPALAAGQAYPRVPCVTVHRSARIALAIDAGFAVLLLAVSWLGGRAVRRHRKEHPALGDMASAAASPG